MSRFSIACEQAARAGGRVLLQYRGKFNVREKGKADLVTEADLASQDAIKSYLYQEFPDHGFLGEEDSDSAGNTPTREFTWVVDPLDGTTNYVHGLENYCVSVALQQGHAQELVVGELRRLDPVHKAVLAQQGKTVLEEIVSSFIFNFCWFFSYNHVFIQY